MHEPSTKLESWRSKYTATFPFFTGKELSWRSSRGRRGELLRYSN